MKKLRTKVLGAAAILFTASAAWAVTNAVSVLKYGDEKADGKRSFGGSGEMIKFSLPASGGKVAGIRIYGSRYGYPQPPKEDFLVYILDKDMEVIHTEKAPYSLFERGENKWVKVKLKKPCKVPDVFWIALDFRAHQTKGVSVSFDTSTNGKYSKVGLPGQETSDVDFGGDWMIQVDLAK